MIRVRPKVAVQIKESKHVKEREHKLFKREEETNKNHLPKQLEAISMKMYCGYLVCGWLIMFKVKGLKNRD